MRWKITDLLQNPPSSLNLSLSDNSMPGEHYMERGGRKEVGREEGEKWKVCLPLRDGERKVGNK